MNRVVVLGAGLVGRTIAQDLSRRFAVTAVDVSGQRLEEAFRSSKVRVKQADLMDQCLLQDLVDGFDLVVGCLPGSLGKRCLEAVIERGRNMVDISFLPEDPFELDQKAQERGVTAVVDMGLAPGMSNVILGHSWSVLDRIDRYECLVGGLPVERTWPYEYKAPFSPADVLEEYKRPARLVENGVVITRPALSDIELVHFDGVGTLQAFNTDGLRSLLRYAIPEMREKTLRYPGHAELIRVLKATGFLDSTELEIGGQRVKPIDLTSRLLFSLWELGDQEEEFTLMRVTIEGRNQRGRVEKHEWYLSDRFDAKTQTSSMARTTGFPCCAVVHLMADGKLVKPGICAPEALGEDPELFDFICAYQETRGVSYRHSVEPRSQEVPFID